MLDTLLTTLDTTVKLVTLVLDLLNTLKALLGITTRLSTLLSSRPWLYQWQSSRILRIQLLYLAVNSTPLTILHLYIVLSNSPPDPHPIDLTPP